eukprot:6835292-Ditylum_brightwellii.AAC.1
MPLVYTKRMDLHPRNNFPWLVIRTKKTMEKISGHLLVKNRDAVGKCQIPVCASCQFAKQKRIPHKATKSQQNPEKEGKLKKSNLFPGQRLSADHYQSAIPERIYSFRDGYHPEDMFNGGTIFLDH